MTRGNLTQALQLSIRAALAAGISVGLAKLLGLEYPLYALFAAVLVTDLSAAETRELGLPRMAGTVVGTVVGAGLSYLLPPGAWGAMAGIFVAMFLSYAMRIPAAARLAGFVSGLVLLQHSAHAWFYAYHRLFETALGVGVAVLVSHVPKLIPSREPAPHGAK